MTRVRKLLLPAFVSALLLLTIGASTASADPGQGGSDGAWTQQCLLPEDPGLE